MGTAHRTSSTGRIQLLLAYALIMRAPDTSYRSIEPRCPVLPSGLAVDLVHVPERKPSADGLLDATTARAIA